MGLSAEALSVTLGDRPVLDGIDLAFAPGTVTAVLGPNGAGKSTLARVLAGLLQPDRGTVKIDGAALTRFSRRDRARRIGYLPQAARVHWDVPAREIVALGRLAHRSAFAALSAADQSAIDRAMAATNTAAFADRPIASLSGGEAARVHLARVLAGEPEWIVADEPLAGLDPAHQLDVLARLREAAGQGTGVIVILHDLTSAARFADAVVLLDQGRVAATGFPDAVLTPDRLRAVYGIEVHVSRDGAGAPLIVPIARTV